MSAHDETIIVLSDDHELHTALRHSFLARAGFHLHVVVDGEDCLETIRRLQPVMAILSLDMNGQYGDISCRRIKEDPALRSTPIALIANYDDEAERERCHESGCNEVLRRPLSSKQLMAAAYRMLKVVVDRYEFRGVVQVEGRCGPDRESLFDCSILNLSGGGAFVETGKLRPIDSVVVLEFSLPDQEEPLSCLGRVAWLNHPEWSRKPQLPIGFGVQFEKLAPEARYDIEEFIHSLR